MKKFLVILASLVAVSLFAAAPSDAYTATRHLYHFSPDNGYNAPIIVTCSWANRYGTALPTVAEGHTLGCNMEGVYVRPDEQIKCYESPSIGWQIFWDATGWHQANYSPVYGCIVQRD
jgi:hypothetical protein